MEQRYVLRHTPRVEPQGQENLVSSNVSGNENSGGLCSHSFLFRFHYKINVFFFFTFFLAFQFVQRDMQMISNDFYRIHLLILRDMYRIIAVIREVKHQF